MRKRSRMFRGCATAHLVLSGRAECQLEASWGLTLCAPSPPPQAPFGVAGDTWRWMWFSQALHCGRHGRLPSTGHLAVNVSISSPWFLLEKLRSHLMFLQTSDSVVNVAFQWVEPACYKESSIFWQLYFFLGYLHFYYKNGPYKKKTEGLGSGLLPRNWDSEAGVSSPLDSEVHLIHLLHFLLQDQLWDSVHFYPSGCSFSAKLHLLLSKGIIPWGSQEQGAMIFMTLSAEHFSKCPWIHSANNAFWRISQNRLCSIWPKTMAAPKLRTSWNSICYIISGV